MSAEIIPFPSVSRPPEPNVDATVETPAARLQRALGMLSAALAEQREAVADWRSAIAIAKLNGSVQGLEHSLTRYQRTLAAAVPATPTPTTEQTGD